MTEIERTIKFGDANLVIRDPLNIVPVAADLIVDCRVVGGVLFLSLGAHMFDGNGPPEVRVVSRLRIPMETVANIQTSVERSLAAMEIAAQEAKKAAN